jgi:ketosteroid isomerase-like protein
MAEKVTREVVDAFYSALTRRDVSAPTALIDDDINWSVSGQVDLLPFCGEHRGKEAVLDVIINHVLSVLPTRDFIPHVKLVDGDRAAILGRLHGTHFLDGRAINYRVTHFVKSRNGRPVKYLSVLDSFDAAEQMLGEDSVVAL